MRVLITGDTGALSANISLGAVNGEVSVYPTAWPEDLRLAADSLDVKNACVG